MSSGGGTPGGSSAGLYLPQTSYQQFADNAWKNITTPMNVQAQNNMALLDGMSPAYWAWPTVQTRTTDILNNPWTSLGMLGAQDAADIYNNYMLPYGYKAADVLGGIGGTAADMVPYASNVINNPAYGTAADVGTRLSQLYEPAVGTALDIGLWPANTMQAQREAPALSSQLSGTVGSAIDYGVNPANILEAERVAPGLSSQLRGGVGSALDYGLRDPNLISAERTGSEMAPAFQTAAGSALDYALQTPGLGAARDYGTRTAGAMDTAARGLLDQAYDPQDALYNRTRAQVMDDTMASLAASGLGSSPYGASVAGKAMSDFGIDWNADRLDRMATGADAAGKAYSTGLTSLLDPILTQGRALATGAQAGSSLGESALSSFTAPALARGTALGYGTDAARGLASDSLTSLTAPTLARGTALATGLGTAADTATGAQNLLTRPDLTRGSILSSGATAAGDLGSSAISSLLDPAKGLTAGMIGGASAIGSLADAARGAYGTGQGFYSDLASEAPTLLGAPYDAYNTMAANDVSALDTAVGIGNDLYSVPQYTLGNTLAYLGAGQNASRIASGIGANNFSQGVQTAAGLGTLGALGYNALSGRSGYGNAGGLFGSQGPIFGTAADASIRAGGPPLALDYAGDSGLGSFLSFINPFSLFGLLA